MKILFLVIVVLHGIIHSFGFLKAFGISEFKELTLPISKPMGVIWLLAMILFLVYGVFYYFNLTYSWLIGLIAVILSQIIIFYFWKDAKFGTIANIIVLLVSFVGLGSFFLQREFESRVKQDFSTNNDFPTGNLTEKDMAHLPAIVQKYLYYTNSVGQPKIKNFKRNKRKG